MNAVESERDLRADRGASGSETSIYRVLHRDSPRGAELWVRTSQPGEEAVLQIQRSLPENGGRSVVHGGRPANNTAAQLYVKMNNKRLRICQI